jgi:hypothetical protein
MPGIVQLHLCCSSSFVLDLLLPLTLLRQTSTFVCGRLIFDAVEVLNLLEHPTYQYLHEYWIEHQPSINTSFYLIVYKIAK